MNNNCNIIKDLLPLYADGVCSKESCTLVEEHIKGCSACRSELETMGDDIKLPSAKDTAALKRIKRRIRAEKIVAGLVAGAVILGGLSLELLRTSWRARRSNQSILKEINSEYS